MIKENRDARREPSITRLFFTQLLLPKNKNLKKPYITKLIVLSGQMQTTHTYRILIDVIGDTRTIWLAVNIR